MGVSHAAVQNTRVACEASAVGVLLGVVTGETQLLLPIETATTCQVPVNERPSAHATANSIGFVHQ
jgi:hypothetical protein